MPHRAQTVLETFLDYHHLPVCVEFDGSQRDRVFSAWLPGMKVAAPGLGDASLIIARSTTPATAVSVLAMALEDKMLQGDVEIESVQFPNLLDATSLVKKLEPNTEAEMLALQYVTDVATRMAVHFRMTRQAYDCRWVATLDANLVDSERRGTIPVSLGNEHPLLALKDMARHLSGRLLSKGDLEFRAPVIPSVQLTLQESILARKLRTRRGSATGDIGEESTSPFPPAADDNFRDPDEMATDSSRPPAKRDLPEAWRSEAPNIADSP